LSFLNVEGDAIPLSESPKTRTDNPGIMNKDVRSILLFNETVSLFFIEPFYGTICHCGNLLSHKFLKVPNFRYHPAKWYALRKKPLIQKDLKIMLA